MDSSTSFIPIPSLAEIGMMSSRSIPMTFSISSLTISGSAPGKSILFTTPMISRLRSMAIYTLARVCASIPWVASTTKSAPSQEARLLETS